MAIIEMEETCREQRKTVSEQRTTITGQGISNSRKQKIESEKNRSTGRLQEKRTEQQLENS